MKSYNFMYENNEFRENIDYNLFQNEKNILIQIFCGEGKKVLKEVTTILKENLQNAICIGTTTDGEIFEGKVSTSKTIISISIFHSTTIKCTLKKNNDSFLNGYETAKEIITANTKLLITFTDGTKTNAQRYLEGISSFNNTVTVSGGMAADNGRFKETYISLNNEILEYGSVAISLNSDILKVYKDIKHGWSPIGIEHTIDRIEDNRIYEVSGMKAIDFYEKYLGDSNLHTFTEFPFMVKRDGRYIARAALMSFKDGSLGYGGGLKKGDTVKLGFANADLIIKTPFEYLKNINEHPSECFFIYSCMARRRYLQNLTSVEIDPFSSMAPTAGFFSYAEFFHENNCNYLMNQTVTLVGLSENPKLQIKSAPTNNMVSARVSSYAKTIQSLTNLIQQSTKDQEVQEKVLQKEITYSKNLLKNQKLFLRHSVHETNTPLAVIMSNIDLYDMELGKNQYLENIEVAVKNIFSIYDDLSYLVKKDQVLYKSYEIDFIDLLRNRVEFFKSVALQMNSNFIFETNKDEILLYFSETKLQRIIDNTITNAIKYTFKDKPIKINLIKKDNKIKFSVSSNSNKIQHPNKIFDEYYREEQSKSGFGLGLNLVKRICDEENVLIEVKSDINETCFTYSFKG